MGLPDLSCFWCVVIVSGEFVMVELVVLFVVVWVAVGLFCL